MPQVIVPVGSPYPLVRDVMNLARVRVNDAMNSIEGDLLTDDDPVTNTILQSSWRWLQGKAYTAGVETPIREVILSALPLQTSMDTALQAYVSWVGCSDGVFEYEQPILPADLIQPLSVWRRNALTYGAGAFAQMVQAEDGLPTYRDTNVYDWRADGMYFYAPQFAQDVRIRYASFREPLDIVTAGAQVPMMMCEDCLSARIAFEYASLRGGAGAQAMAGLAEDAFQVIVQRSSRRKQRANPRRQPYSGRRGWRGAYPATWG